MAVRDRADQPLTDWTTTIDASKLGGKRGFIQEHQAVLIDPALRPSPGLALFLDIWTALLRGMGGLFS